MSIQTTLSACKLTAQAVMCMYKGAKKISDIFLTRKIEKFAEKPFSEKSQQYIDGLDTTKFEQLQEQIIHALTHAESTIKAIYIKNLTEAHCRQEIDWITFCRMNHVLNQIFTFDLRLLVMFYNNEKAEEKCDEITQNKLNLFAQCGLVDYSNILDANGATLRDMFLLNDFGRKFIVCALPDLDELSKKNAHKQFNDMWSDFIE